MRQELEHAAELALIRSIYDILSGSLKPGRLQGKFIALQKEADKQLSLMGIHEAELEELKIVLDSFAVSTGWADNSRSVGTILSFVMQMVEDSRNKFRTKILELLNEIFDYFERVKPFSPLCYNAGAVAAEKWQRIKEAS